MKIGKRTQAYFIGFLVGVAIVSVLIDFRRSQAERMEKAKTTWERTEYSQYAAQPQFLKIHKAGSHVTAMRQVDGDGEPTGKGGLFFEDGNGVRYWLNIDGEGATLCSGTEVSATARPGLEYDLMVSGFEHQGHTVLSTAEEVPLFRVSIDAGSAFAWIEAVENLRSKASYIASVDFVPVDS